MKEKKSILNNKGYLYLTEFFSGMTVMAVELGANRMDDRDRHDHDRNGARQSLRGPERG